MDARPVIRLGYHTPDSLVSPALPNAAESGPTSLFRARDLRRRPDKASSGDGARIAVVTGARPNIPKAVTVLCGLRFVGLDPVLIHSGQHPSLLGVDFASALGLTIDVQLPGPRARASGTARMAAMIEQLGDALTIDRYDAVIVMGDVSTTVAAALAAKQNGLRVTHLEAGLRSREADDPEEVNRRQITALSDLHLPSTVEAANNLRREGIPSDAIVPVGNAMVETFLRRGAERGGSDVLRQLGLPGGHVLLTIHKPPTLADPKWLRRAVLTVSSASRPVVFPMHPSLEIRLPDLRRMAEQAGIIVTGPLPYDDLGRLMETASCVVTDSAGLQEESTIAGVRCVTFGIPTARPETCTTGTNRFTGFDLEACRAAIGAAQTEILAPQRPALWDASVSLRISQAVPKILGIGQRVS